MLADRMANEVLARRRRVGAQLARERTRLRHGEWVRIRGVVPNVTEMVNGQMFCENSVLAGFGLTELAPILDASAFFVARFGGGRDLPPGQLVCRRGSSGVVSAGCVVLAVLGVVVVIATVLALAVDVRGSTVGVSAALDELGLEFGVNVSQMDDEDRPVRGLVSARGMVAVEDAHVVRRMM